MPAYGVAESWEYLPGAKGHASSRSSDGLTFNNGAPITAEDVVFSLRAHRQQACRFPDFRHAAWGSASAPS